MNKIFDALLKESQFTKELFDAGYEQIGKANYAQRGIYFQAFTSLSTGLERIGKLCLILDFMGKNNGNLPSDNYMKTEIGHDINILYNKSQIVLADYSFTLSNLQNLNEIIYIKILNILSRFGKGDRYSNIDLIVNTRNYKDPINVWYKDVDLDIYKNNIKESKKEYIKVISKFIDPLISEYTSVVHTSEDEKDIDSVYQSSIQANINAVVVPYRRLYVFRIIRYFVELLEKLQYHLHDNGIQVPYFSEIFCVYSMDEYYIKRRKTLV
ncbi:hypothetical protein AGMMS49587_00370 [Spirochaetia bacterium]|nr:hypothetical protein AGMMS49587_00370 [Spirochaetia bacterium]